MSIFALRTRATTAASLGIAATAAASVLTAPPAQAATTYWQFKSVYTGMCLTAGTSGVAWASTCIGNDYQKWQWIGTYYGQLKNKATGRCLATDNITSSNAVWTSGCVSPQPTGQRWSYNWTTQQFTTAYGTSLQAYSGGGLTTGPGSQAWDGWTG